MARLFATAAVVLTLVLIGCGDEDPTGVGSGVNPEGRVRTVEMVLTASQFLERDTTASGFSDPWRAEFLLLANDFAEGLNARVLVGIGTYPQFVNYLDEDSVVQVDSLPNYIGGRVVLRVDTLRTTIDTPVRVGLYRIAEPWDPFTATWTARSVAVTTPTPWQQPGGTLGELLASGELTADADTLVFPLDSSLIAEFSDTVAARQGVALILEESGARVLATGVTVRLDARPTPRPDTVVTTTVVGTRSIFIEESGAIPVANLRVGGVPTWRSYFVLKERLDTLRIPCEAAPCPRLAEASITAAYFQIHPVASPAALAPPDSVRVVPRAVFTSDLLPLTRSPLGDPPQRSTLIAPERFTPEGATGEPVSILISGFIAALASPPPPEEQEQPARAFVLLGVPEPGRFGVATFADAEAPEALAPRLRLFLTVVERNR